MRKWFTCLTAFIIAINLLSVPVGAAESDTAYDDAVRALLDFEILTEEFEDIDQTEQLTREKAAMWLYRLMELDVEYESSVFSDVAPGGQYANAILALNERGIISGFPDGRYRPTSTIQYQDFAKLLVELLGYKQTAELLGGYPSGYLQVAANLRLDQGAYTAPEDPMTIGAAAQIFYNALQADMQKISLNENNQIQIEADRERTLLSQYKDIYKIRGRITKNARTGLTVPEGAGEGNAEIDGVIYGAGKTDADAQLGKEVYAFYREYPMENTLIHIEPLAKANEITILAEDIVREESDRTTLTYETDSTRNRSLKISSTVDVIYNGKAHPDLEADRFYPFCGQIALLDSDNDKIYDVVFITDYTVMFVSHAVEYSRTVFNKFTSAGFVESLQFDENGEIDICDEVGEPMEFSDIAENDILFAAVSETGTKPYYQLVVSKNSVGGTFSSINDDTVTVDGTEYELSEAYKLAVANGDLKAPVLGDTYTFYIDAYGRVTGFSKEYTGTQYGYLRKVYTDEMDEKVYARVFCRDGSWELYELRDTVQINGEPFKKEVAVNIISAGEMIRYTVDSSARLRTMDTAVTTSETDTNLNDYIEQDTFRKAEINGTIGNNKYYSNTNSFSNAFFLNQDVTVFLIPTASGAPEEDFACTDQSYFKSENRYTLTVFDMDEYMFSSIYMVGYDSSSSDSLESSIGRDDYCMMIEETNEAVVNGEQVSIARGLMKGQEWSYTSAEANTFAGLKKGDIIRTKYDDAGKLKQYIMVHRLGTEELVSNVPDFNNAVYIYGNVLSVDYANRLVRMNDGKDRTVIVRDSAFITVYDEGENAMYGGTMQDISAGDYVVFRMQSSVPYEVFIIRK